MGGKSQTVTQKTQPWKDAQPYLKAAFGQAQGLYNQGAFAPVPYGFGQYASTTPAQSSAVVTTAPTTTPTVTSPTTTAPSSGSGLTLESILNGGGLSGLIGGGGSEPGPVDPVASNSYNPFGGMTPTQMEAAARSAAEMRIPGFGSTTQGAMQSIIDRASGGASGLDAAKSFLTGMMGGGGQYPGMQAVRDNILGSAIPAATSMFSGSGMTNSSAAMDGVGRAATEALAPFEYGAYENAQNRGMQAAGMMPGMEQAMYMPDQMRLGMGQMQDQLAQQRASMAQQAYGEAAGLPAANFSPYLNAIMGLGGMGSSSSSTQPQPGTGLGPAIMGGLGMYGTLAGAGLGGGMAGLGGLLAGLAGLSDRRAKEDIERIGTTDGGTPIYRYRYKGTDNWQIGVMADEVPHAIKGYTDTGLALVDYAKVA